MERIKYGLNKEEYNHLISIANRAERANVFEKEYCTDSIRYGYGLYGVGDLGTEKDRYFIEITIGSTCD